MAGYRAEFIDETIFCRTRSDLSTAIDNTILNMDADTPQKMAKDRENKFNEHVTNAVAKAQADAIRETGKPDLSDDQVVQIARDHGGERTTQALEALHEHISKVGLDDFYEEYKQTAPDSGDKRRKLVREIADKNSRKATEVMADIRDIAKSVQPSLDSAAPKLGTRRQTPGMRP